MSRGGNGQLTVCMWCDALLADMACTIEVGPPAARVYIRALRLERDRFVQGSSYRLDGLVASCGPCNRARTYEETEIPEGSTYGPVSA